MGHFLIIRYKLSLPCCIHSEWRISLRFFAGDLSLPCGIAFNEISLTVKKMQSVPHSTNIDTGHYR